MGRLGVTQLVECWFVRLRVPSPALCKQGIVAHACNPSILKVEAGRSDDEDGAVQMSELVKAFTAKPHDLSLIPGTPTC